MESAYDNHICTTCECRSNFVFNNMEKNSQIRMLMIAPMLMIAYMHTVQHLSAGTIKANKQINKHVNASMNSNFKYRNRNKANTNIKSK